MKIHLRGALTPTGKPVLLFGNPYGNDKRPYYMYLAGPFYIFVDM